MKMQRKKESKFLLAIVAIALLGISIGYALISRDFDFEGTINVKGNTWNISVGTIDEPISTGETSYEELPKVNVDESGNVTINYNVMLNKPGDTYSFIIPLQNVGTIDAILDGVTDPNLEEVANSLDYKVELVTDTNAIPLSKGVKLPASSEINVRISLAYKNDSIENLASSNLNENLVTTLHFLQDMKN